MDLKKTKKLKRKYRGFKIQVMKKPPIHVYRCEDKNAPFSKWERITEKPFRGEVFSDRDAEENPKFYYYKYTEIDEFGNEGFPKDMIVDTYTFMGRKMDRTPENFIVGINLYWSLDPDLPLEEWNKLFDEPRKIEDFTFDSPVKEPFYFYAKYVNSLGKEIGKPSDVQYIVPKK